MLTDELADLEQAKERNKEEAKMKQHLNRVGSGIKYQFQLAKRQPHIAFISLLVFAVLCGAGLAMIFMVEDDRHEEAKSIAMDLSTETGQWFSDQLDQAILPLFSMAQFVSELEIFHDLPDQIGPAFENGSLPFKPPRTEESPVTHRNVSGVCDAPHVVERFNRIAATVKRNANMNGVLVNLQLAPQAVVCLLHPMVNTEDFPPGIVMNNTGAWGHDLLTDPARKFIAEATIPSEKIVIAGPLTLRQCQDCDPTVERAFIARIPIAMEGKEIVVNDVPYEKWGFAVALINWNALIERSSVYQTFEERGLEFQLTRTDRKFDAENNVTTEKVVVLAETPSFANATSGDWETVTTALDTTNNEWEMNVSYQYNKWETWKVVSVVATVLVSFFIGLLCFTILIQKENLTLMKKRYEEDVAQPQKLRLRAFLEETSKSSEKMDIQQVMNSNPIADIYANCTVLYAAIDGFTVWASEREASQVFVLLQTIFFSFDETAKKYGVFRVEGIGENYVCATGVPEPQEDHALKMLHFAKECLGKSRALMKTLEMSLGPDTGDLRVKIGIHSGPVTAGVLVGRESNGVKLCGDTLNICAAVNKAGEADRIHLSHSTVQQLLAGGFKKRWIERRRDSMQWNGMQTYWVRTKSGSGGKAGSHAARSLLQEQGQVRFDESGLADETSSQRSGRSGSDMWELDNSSVQFPELEGVSAHLTASDNKQDRLVEWQVNMMTKLLKKIVARRNKSKKRFQKTNVRSPDLAAVVKAGGIPLQHVAEIVTLPTFDSSSAVTVGETNAVKIKPEVISQLRGLVRELAANYRDNPFHNFEHASHVTMSVHKMLDRIVSPDEVNYDGKAKSVAADLHKHTFGITSDPLTHFAIVFSALIHDVDHTGVSNGQLGKEQPLLADKYRNQSLAEQHSVESSWELLQQPCYKDLHECLFANDAELQRFRQLVVNVVLATDIFDKELKALRNKRWDRAFHGDEIEPDESVISCSLTERSSDASSSHGNGNESTRSVLKLQDTNRKATIVIEHIIQASDVAHTMQHWQVYLKWNEKLFNEMYVAWKMGRAAKDPTDSWYKGEIWFFDNYVIPLTQKLDECGVFGVASDECLHHALENRKEWVLKGEAVVAEMAKRCQAMRLMPKQILEESEEEDDESSYQDEPDDWSV
ncbi:Receptor-type guanylate cyclase gcy [Seminavis robusta]|uniref:Receptor-type guanylate cyclase gcy n=1 Tax=Seminavis robusta TaxID=568900 RepID=A0A9N8DYF3_9STRA|nr:Receptor-type guanylate cyclase gcy [Seminavis robusta]|eukprot:Sro467_g148960.1 Receptor-type guanylate cyclase gcy (1158) ;mRNA; f:42535-47271